MFSQDQFDLKSFSVESAVADQPLSDQETYQGALHRARSVKQMAPEHNYWVGIEGGCDYLNDVMMAFAWVVVLSELVQGQARSALFQLPPDVQALVEDGLELGDADDKVFGEINSKRKSGAVGLLTDDVVTRTYLYEQAVILALIPFKNPQLY